MFSYCQNFLTSTSDYIISGCIIPCAFLLIMVYTKVTREACVSIYKNHIKQKKNTNVKKYALFL